MSAFANLDSSDVGVVVVVGCVLITLVAVVVLWFRPDCSQHEQ
jgi:hypothetical protein